jgi:hypothetical protein
MIPVMKWPERTFNFDLPLGIYPCIIARLLGTPPHLNELVKSLPATKLIERPRQGWSIQEHVGHLIDVETLHDARIDDYLKQKDELTPADLSGRMTEAADYNGQAMDEILTRFRDVRLRLVARLEALDEATIARPSHHPRLGVPMRPIDMAYFAAEHDDHHIALIRQIIAGG